MTFNENPYPGKHGIFVASNGMVYGANEADFLKSHESVDLDKKITTSAITEAIRMCYPNSVPT